MTETIGRPKPVQRVQTRSSVYEVDEENQRIRRLEGSYEPTARQGQDGEWRSYTGLFGLGVGYRMIIVWAVVSANTDNPGGLVAQSTQTSEIISITEGGTS